MKPWSPNETTFHRWNEKKKNMGGVYTYITQPYETKFMSLKQGHGLAVCTRLITKVSNLH